MKTFLITLLMLVIGTNAFAASEQRKITSGRETASAQLLSFPGTVYDIEIIATSSSGVAVLMDSATAAVPDGSTASNNKMVVEVGEATSGNSKHANLGNDGIKFYKGIYIYLNNATAIVYYN